MADLSAQEQEEVRAHGEAIASTLREMVYLSRQTQRSIEQRLGLSGGYVSRMLGNWRSLRLVHVLRVLKAIGVEPGKFFRQAYPLAEEPAQTAAETTPAPKADATSLQMFQLLLSEVRTQERELARRDLEKSKPEREPEKEPGPGKSKSPRKASRKKPATR